MARDLGDGVDAGQDVGLGAAKGGGYEETEEVGVAQVGDDVVGEVPGGLDDFGSLGERGTE